jgi:enamine deaminase RidA (YjgF/YER057c/UK114 family)
MASDGVVRHAGDLVAQTAAAFGAVLSVLKAANAKPEHLVRLRIYVTDADLYRRHAKAIGERYRDAFGRWYPAMTLVEVSRLYDPAAMVEVEGEAVVPD